MYGVYHIRSKALLMLANKNSENFGMKLKPRWLRCDALCSLKSPKSHRTSSDNKSFPILAKDQHIHKTKKASLRISGSTASTA